MPLGAHITLGLVGPEVSPPARHLSLPFLEANSSMSQGHRGPVPQDHRSIRPTLRGNHAGGGANAACALQRKVGLLVLPVRLVHSGGYSTLIQKWSSELMIGETLVFTSSMSPKRSISRRKNSSAL